MELNYKELGGRIRSARKNKGYTLESLSELTGLSVTHLGNIETGKSKVSLGSLVLIANSLDTTIDSLLYDSLHICIDSYDQEFKKILDDCSPEQKEYLLRIVTLAKDAFSYK